MKEDAQVTQHTDGTNSDGLWRWLLGGLAAGGIILGLLIAAYAIGYHRGERAAAPQPSTATPSATTPTATATTPATPSSPRPGGPAVTSIPALIAAGKTLYTSDNCSGCHSLTGAAGAGPSFKGLAGSTTTLLNGKKVAADDAYLERAIADPDAQIVTGYTAGLMAPAIASFDLAHKPDDIRALVAFIKAQK
jgi:mono/diheme cytochrome c family protein